MRKHLIALCLAAAVAPAVATTGSLAGPGSQAAAAPGDCDLPAQVLNRSDLPQGISVVACEAVGRRLMVADGVGVNVPAPGHGVTVSTLGTDHDASVVLSVDVTPDGRIDYESHTAAPLSTGSSATSPAACDDTAYGLMGHKWYSTFEWWINDSNKPANLTAAATQTAIKEGTGNIVLANNDCGMVDDISATEAYQGLTASGTDLYHQDGLVYCSSGASIDGQSTVGFGWMPGGYLAATCTWRVAVEGQVAQAVESDMRINLNKGWTTTPGSASCDRQYDLEYIVTHERGHTFGLADLSGEHAKLTMFESAPACVGYGRSLGRGDIRGLRQRY